MWDANDNAGSNFRDLYGQRISGEGLPKGASTLRRRLPVETQGRPDQIN